MINNFIEAHIRDFFGFEPTSEQQEAIAGMARFLVSRTPREAFLLTGFAGTGKTTLVGALVKAMESLELKVELMAPTGRAAKVFALYSHHPASTIHRRIYRQKSLVTDEPSFSLGDNLKKDTLFIVDEASMIADDDYGSVFDSGRLLEDLIRFVYSGEGCRLLLMGDEAQLPPVGHDRSPALSIGMLESFGLDVQHARLTQVLRQAGQSGILANATAIRQRIGDLSRGLTANTLLRLKVTDDVETVPGNELVEKLYDIYDHVGLDESIVICRSNKNAGIYNRGIRAQILDHDEALCSGERIMIVKNNYYWVRDDEPADAPHDASAPTFLANGDTAVVRRVRNVRDMYGFTFADVRLEFPDYDGYELEATVMLDTLTSESPSLTREEHERLFNAVMEDYADIPLKADRFKALRENPYYNALQIKYAYAVTCHKAQGGQWHTVVLDQGWMPPESVGGMDYYRWLYTAFTRAQEKVVLVNWRKEEIENN